MHRCYVIPSQHSTKPILSILLYFKYLTQEKPTQEQSLASFFGKFFAVLAETSCQNNEKQLNLQSGKNSPSRSQHFFKLNYFWRHLETLNLSSCCCRHHGLTHPIKQLLNKTPSKVKAYIAFKICPFLILLSPECAHSSNKLEGLEIQIEKMNIS